MLTHLSNHSAKSLLKVRQKKRGREYFLNLVAFDLRASNQERRPRHLVCINVEEVSYLQVTGNPTLNYLVWTPAYGRAGPVATILLAIPL
jgi:hypothetical protein